VLDAAVLVVSVVVVVVTGFGSTAALALTAERIQSVKQNGRLCETRKLARVLWRKLGEELEDRRVHGNRVGQIRRMRATDLNHPVATRE
jgi:hypothetical protein